MSDDAIQTLAAAINRQIDAIDQLRETVERLTDEFERGRQSQNRLNATLTPLLEPENESQATELSQAASDDTDDPSPSNDDEAAQRAADRLQAAYDGVIGDMQVKAHSGKVWVQTGRDTPEDWPHPGGATTFDVLLRTPEQVKYVGEGTDDYPPHEWYDDKPGEWWRNALDPSDVDDYIDEVLS